MEPELVPPIVITGHVGGTAIFHRSRGHVVRAFAKVDELMALYDRLPHMRP